MHLQLNRDKLNRTSALKLILKRAGRGMAATEIRRWNDYGQNAFISVMLCRQMPPHHSAIFTFWRGSSCRGMQAMSGEILQGEGSQFPGRPPSRGQNEGYFLVMVSTTAVFLRRWASLTEMNCPVLASLPT